LVVASAPRTVAVLGEMAELGDTTRQAHQEAGRLVARLGVDVLVAVGDAEARALAGAAMDGSSRLRTIVVPDAGAALSALHGLLRSGDVVLAKASHSMHLEELAVALGTAGGPAA
jgi:UDP-N-acetylmuramoyl-tripeptide--D-alanyl-D-alanine ligase